MNFTERLKNLRTEKKLSQLDMGNLLGISQVGISHYESGNRQPDLDTLNRISDFFNVSIDYLLGKTDIRNLDLPKGAYVAENTKRLPVLGVVRAGEPLFAEQNIIGYANIDVNLIPSGECFYLKVVGDSMNLSHIVEGQLIMIRSQEEVENGEIALILVNGEDATIKKFYKTDNMVTLMPHSSNPTYQPRMIDLKSTSVKVIGKVVGIFISL
jgi:repressor LexA